MPFRSLLFSGNRRLEACLVQDSAHISIGDTGPHVQLIHDALRAIDGLDVASDEIANMQYGRTTAAAVLAYKKKRKIINRSYQSTEDDERKVKHSMQQWINRVAMNPVLCHDEELRSFIETDFVVSFYIKIK